MKPQDNIEILVDDLLIRNFLDKTLSDAELEKFKSKLGFDDDFSKQVTQYLQIQSSINAVKKNQSITKPKRIFIWPGTYMKVAAAVLLLITSSVILFFVNTTSPGELASSQFMDTRLSLLRTNNNESNIDLFNQSLKAYHNDQKEKAISTLQEMADKNPERAFYWFVLADMYFKYKDYPSAVHYYRKGLKINSKDSFSRWNLALTLVLSNQISEAKILLTEFAQEEDLAYRDKAIELLDAIE